MSASRDRGAARGSAITVDRPPRPQPQVAGVPEQLAVLGAFAAANLVDGLGQLGLDVVAIKGDLRGGQVLQRADQVALAHVLTDLADLLGAPATSGQIVGKTPVDAGVAAGRGEHHAALTRQAKTET